MTDRRKPKPNRRDVRANERGRRDTRTSTPPPDPRDVNLNITVRSYHKENGTIVDEHKRSKPRKKLKKITTTRGINKGVVWTTQKEYEVDDRE